MIELINHLHQHSLFADIWSGFDSFDLLLQLSQPIWLIGVS